MIVYLGEGPDRRSQRISTDIPIVGKESKDIPIALIDEIMLWCKIAFLSSIAWFAGLVPWLASIAFIGHTSTVNLSALSAVEVWINSFMDIVWTGVGMTQSVLVAQAHGFESIYTMRGWAYISFVFYLIGYLKFFLKITYYYQDFPLPH